MRRFVAAALIFCALAAGGVAVAIATDPPADGPPPPGVGVIEGRLASGPTVDSPVGAPVLFGQVRVAYCCVGASSQRTGLSAEHLWAGDVGDPLVDIETSRGVERVRLGDPWTTWRVTRSAPDVRRPSLAGLPVVAAAVPRWRQLERGSSFRHFLVSVLAVRPGDDLVVEVDPAGDVTRTWVGGRSAFDAHRDDGEGLRLALTAALSALAALLGAAAILTLVLRRGPRST